MYRTSVFIIISLVFVLSFSPALAAKRTALVIGNGSYKSMPLNNPVNDADDMSRALKRLGFEVILIKNADKQRMMNAMRDFGRKLSGSEIGLFFYAGHGMQIKGTNYLIPVKSGIQEEAEVQFYAIDAGMVLAKMESAGNPLNLVILDACRDNPFKRSFRSSAKGLARMDVPDGSIIAYATKAGSVAEDGQGRNGTYTKALLNNMENPELDVRDMFNRVGLEVKNKTLGQQVPWTSNDPFPDYFLARGTATIDSPSTGSTAKGSMKIESEPIGAEIFIHGQSKGRAPIEIAGMAQGSYRIEARLSGYLTEQKKVSVNPGRKAVVTFYLDTAISKAKLFVTTSPLDCRVRILNINPVFYNGIELEKGRYKLEVSKSGYETKLQWVDINSSQGIDLYVELEKQAVLSKTIGKAVSGQTWTDPVMGMEFVRVDAGCF
ncbi:MAG: caspase family protein [Desulfobacula sp.]|jgi:hypothetical protein|nr:caspase family protein [Desulfobacula sp.]